MDIDTSAVGTVLFVTLPLTALIVRIFVLPDEMSLDEFVAPPMEDGPHGVQEEEPARWRPERLTPRERALSDPALRAAALGSPHH